MTLTLRARLFTLVVTTTLALLVLLASGALIPGRVDDHLEQIRKRYLPRVGLQPRLDGEFERLQRALQDAVAASDVDLLRATREHREAFSRELARARGAIPADDTADLERAMSSYYDAAYRVSERMIRGQTDAGLTADIETMQERQERAAARLDELASFDEEALASVFESVSEARETAGQLRLLISGLCMVSVLGLSLWIRRGVLGRLTDLTAGFERFGAGAFDERIPVERGDEVGDVASRANDMAERLQQLGDERSRLDWLKSGRVGLAQALHGVLEPREVAERAVEFLAKYVGAPAGALYRAGGNGELELLGGYAIGGNRVETAIGRGEGLVGQAALSAEVTVIETSGDHLRLCSAVVEVSPRAVALVPLLHAGTISGVLELAMLKPWLGRHEELLLSVRETIAIALDAARARVDMRALLAETTAQAGALDTQRVALERKNAELNDARRKLEQKADELAAASRYKSQFLANMSHELRTPLNGIIGFAELLHDGVVAPDAPEHREFLGDILTSGRHLLQLINDVLDLSKVEAGKLEFHPEPVDLDRVIGEVLAILRTTASAKRIKVDATVDPGIGPVVLDPARLKQVLYNYLSNAIKFTPEGGRVTVRALPETDERLRIEVEDTGLGIDAADLDRLFVEFQQIGHGAKTEGGTGLGLALTKRLVEAQGGRVGVRSTCGRGSTFNAVLPRRAALAANPALAAAPLPLPRPGARSVLIVEDDPRDQQQLVDALTRAGYTVELASTGVQALTRCRERAFDAITLDLLLPDMNGLDVLGEIRARGRNRNVPIIVLTVVTEPGAVAGFAVHDLLQKPLREDALLASLARAGVSAQEPGTVLLVDDDSNALKLMATSLAQVGIDARCASDGETGLRATRDDMPRAIVLDLFMPGMDGFEFLDRLRGDPAGRSVPVIVWTVADLDDGQKARLRASAQAVVSKGNGGTTAVMAELETFLAEQGGGL